MRGGWFSLIYLFRCIEINYMNIWTVFLFKRELGAVIASQAKKPKAASAGSKSCWKGYAKHGTKMKGGKRVNNCVKCR